MFGEHRQGRDIQRQGAVFVAFEVEAHGQRCLDFDAFDVGKLGAITQAALGHQQVVGVANVLGGDRFAIGKTRLRVDEKAQRQTVFRAFHFFRHQTVHRVRLIQRALGQWRIQQTVDLRHADAFVYIRQQMIEVADFDCRAPHRPTLRRLRIGVVEMAEAGGVFGRFAVNGQCVLRGSGRTGGTREQGEGGEHQCGKNQSHRQPWNAKSISASCTRAARHSPAVYVTETQRPTKGWAVVSNRTTNQS